MLLALTEWSRPPSSISLAFLSKHLSDHEIGPRRGGPPSFVCVSPHPLQRNRRRTSTEDIPQGLGEGNPLKVDKEGGMDQFERESHLGGARTSLYLSAPSDCAWGIKLVQVQKHYSTCIKALLVVRRRLMSNGRLLPNKTNRLREAYGTT